ncbi:VOC family protein [Candidatus Bathyarchaeota archaeon]|nr:VOC family protein [Candidatus Bathyarchaeota archaeon]
MEFKNMVQVGLVVSDIERARALWAKLLEVEEPPIVETEDWDFTHMKFRGEASKGRAKLTFFKLENMVLEIIEPIGGPSTWQNFLEKHGEGIHHIAFVVENADESMRKLLENGASEEQKGRFKGGGYFYLDSRKSLGAIIELLYYEK